MINGVSCGDTEGVATALENISQSIQDMTDALKLMQGSQICNDNKSIFIVLTSIFDQYYFS